MEIYDPIHGIIEIDDLSKKIIDTEEFQRLRNIKQLGCCYYVFPGASHNRFEHSLGVYHLAKKYMNILNNPCEYNEYFDSVETRCILTAALIHDIGHGPFSHLFDDLLPEEKNHEYRSGELFKLMNQKYNLNFTDDEIKLILDIIFPPKNPPKDKKYLYQIVSNNNGIDVDRFDYIMRDIKMIGLNYGIEYERIMNKSKIIDSEIHYSEKIKTHIEDFFRIRFIMYKEVYNHHAVRSIEFMMKDFITKIEPIFGIKEIVLTDHWGKFIELTDSITDLINFLPQNQIILDLIEIMYRIKTRNIYKSIGQIITENYYTIHVPSTNLIIDTVHIKYYGNESCKYYTNCKKMISRIKNDSLKDEFITTIYYKDKKYKTEAENIFN